MRARQARERSNGIWHATIYDAIYRALRMEYIITTSKNTTHLVQLKVKLVSFFFLLSSHHLSYVRLLNANGIYALGAQESIISLWLIQFIDFDTIGQSFFYVRRSVVRQLTNWSRLAFE